MTENATSKEVYEILNNTSWDYLFSTAKLHLDSYPQVNGNPYELISLLYEIEIWEPFSHEALMPGCRAFMAPLAGYLGIVPVSSLPRAAEIEFSDPKDTGVAMGTVKDYPYGPWVLYTVLIAGFHNEKEICFTFHTGDPVKPSVLPAKEWNGKSILAVEALRMGIEYVRCSGIKK